jgi:TetR/AcrR family transcriptional regulator, cholesterol catabolism regulator
MFVESGSTMPATRREAMKLATRQRVMDAARDLFTEQGYMATTIREIAVRAEVSTGSVFTTFESKEEILSTIISERQGEMVEAITAARLLAIGDARSRLKAAMAAAYAYEFQRLLLVVEQIGASWTWAPRFEEINRTTIVHPFAFIREILDEGVREKTIRADVNLDMFSDIILGVYLRNFRHAWFRKWSLEKTCQAANQQMDLLFDGAALQPSS